MSFMYVRYNRWGGCESLVLEEEIVRAYNCELPPRLWSNIAHQLKFWRNGRNYTTSFLAMIGSLYAINQQRL